MNATKFDTLGLGDLGRDFDELAQAIEGEKGAPRGRNPGFHGRTFEEGCPKCGGTGKFRGYTGRLIGDCFACKGAGKKTFVTTPESRAKARTTTAQKAATREEEKRVWRAAHKAELDWLRAQVERQWTINHQGGKGWDFPQKLEESLTQYGTLTEGQIGAIRKCMVRDTERTQTRAVKAQARVDAAPVVDMTKIEAAFEKARTAAHKAGAQGVRWLKLRLDTFVFLDMPAKGQWKAAVRVTEGEAKLGRVEGGQFIRFAACTDEQLARILAAAADPAAAAVAFGLRFGSCACCGRELTNPISIKLSVGPICAEKWGWGFLAEGVDAEEVGE